MKIARYGVVLSALASASCTTTNIDTQLATTSLRNSIYDSCGWAAEPASIPNVIPLISKGRDGFSRTTKAICAEARAAGGPGGQITTVEVDGRSVSGRFLAPGEQYMQL